jgi:hypothetical protein
MQQAAKKPNPVARLDEIIATIERCREEADEIIDQHVKVLRELCPGVPASSLRACEITNRAGTTLDIAAALRLVRETLV